MQAIAWHMLRDPAIVLRAASAGPDGIEGVELSILWAERQQPEDLARANEEMGRRKRRGPLTEARRVIVTWARTGRLPTRATNARTGERHELHADDWAQLDLVGADDTGQILDAFPVRRDGSVDLSLPRAWMDVRFDRGALVRLCEEEQAGAASTPSQPSADASAAAPAKVERKHTGLDYRQLDAILVQEMHRMIEGSEARSRTDAARAICKRAKGNSTDASKVTRLVKHYRETYGDV